MRVPRGAGNLNAQPRPRQIPVLGRDCLFSDAYVSSRCGEPNLLSGLASGRFGSCKFIYIGLGWNPFPETNCHQPLIEFRFSNRFLFLNNSIAWRQVGLISAMRLERSRWGGDRPGDRGLRSRGGPLFDPQRLGRIDCSRAASRDIAGSRRGEHERRWCCDVGNRVKCSHAV